MGCARRWTRSTSLAAMVVALYPALSRAADLAPAPSVAAIAPPSWEFAITVYGWASGLNGNQALFGLPPVDVNLKFADVLPDLDFAASGFVEVRKGQFGFAGEANFVKLTATDTGPAGFLRLKLGSSAFFGLAAGTYRVAEGNWGSLDIIGGAKIFSYSNKVTLSSPGPLPVLIGNESVTWVDGTLGLKLRYNITQEWFLTSWAMAGAGGSRYHWDALAAVGYQITPAWSVSAGYRAIGVDYKKPRFTYDMIQHGPILGVTARF